MLASHAALRPNFSGTLLPGATYHRMRTVLVVAVSLFLISSAAASPLERLRNASANELCWDSVRGFAREKYPTMKLGDAVLIQASLTSPAGPSPVKQARKNFPGIRSC